MQPLNAARTSLGAASALLSSGLAQAHSGHGMPGAAHWHASDALVYLVLAVAMAASLWLARRK